jgi:hypothetical protein
MSVLSGRRDLLCRMQCIYYVERMAGAATLPASGTTCYLMKPCARLRMRVPTAMAPAGGSMCVEP